MLCVERWKSRRTLIASGVLAFVSCPVALAQVELQSWEGNFAGDGFGVEVAAVGDVDGDGIGDVIVGSNQSVGGLLPGYATTVSGRTGEVIYVHTAQHGDPDFGEIVSGVGDINADGRGDLAVWEPLNTRVALFSGMDGSPIGFLQATGPFAYQTKIDGGKDVDGDGIPDIIVGRGGGATVFSGATLQVVLQVGSSGGPYGSIALLGDLDGDGLSDIGTADSYNGAASVTVYSGQTGSTLFWWLAPATTGTPKNLESVGDVNADGVPDIVVGGYLGDAVVLSGVDGQVIHTLNSPGDSRSVCAVGDFDGDGVPDIAGGSTGSGASGVVQLFSGSTGVELLRINDPAGASLFGGAIAGPGDVNGDGCPDIVIGDPTYDTSMADVGMASIWSFTSCVAISYCQASPNTVGSGASISYVGSPSVSDNDLGLVTTGCPANQPGIYFYGSHQGQVPFGDGFRCVTGLVVRFQGSTASNQSGIASDTIDFTRSPFSSGPGALAPGSTWHFQYWYRDPVIVGAGWNLSDGLQITFCP